jgi:hypothetical protein
MDEMTQRVTKNKLDVIGKMALIPLLLLSLSAQADQKVAASSPSDPLACAGKGSSASCIVGSVAAASAVWALYNKGQYWGKEHERPQSGISVIDTTLDAACTFKLTEAWAKHIQTYGNVKKRQIVSYNGDPKGFLKAAWTEYLAHNKDVVTTKTWRGDYLPKVAGAAVKKVNNLAPLSTAAEIAAKQYLSPTNQLGKSESYANDYNNALLSAACDDKVKKAIDAWSPNKDSAIKAITDSALAKAAGTIDGKIGGFIFVNDLIVKAAYDSGNIGTSVVNDIKQVILQKKQQLNLAQQSAQRRMFDKLKRVTNVLPSKQSNIPGPDMSIDDLQNLGKGISKDAHLFSPQSQQRKFANFFNHAINWARKQQQYTHSEMAQATNDTIDNIEQSLPAKKGNDVVYHKPKIVVIKEKVAKLGNAAKNKLAEFLKKREQAKEKKAIAKHKAECANWKKEREIALVDNNGGSERIIDNRFAECEEFHN